MSVSHWGAVGIALALLAGCASGGGGNDEVGRITRVEDGQAIDRATLVDALAAADFVLLGENHEDAEHHRLQAELVQALQARWPRPAPVAFEMIGTDRQLALTEFVQAHPGDADGLALAVDWAEEGWPDWRMYAPIAQATLDADGQIVAAGLPRHDVQLVRAAGPTVLDSALIRRTGLDRPLEAPFAESLRTELAAVHCGDLPMEVIEGMAQVQRARDAVMADRLATLAGRGHAILVAGVGHVRTDRGVPWYLRRLEPEASVASLAFVGAPPGAPPPDDLPYDYVWFTPPARAAARPDPCAS